MQWSCHGLELSGNVLGLWAFVLLFIVTILGSWYTFHKRKVEKRGVEGIPKDHLTRRGRYEDAHTAWICSDPTKCAFAVAYTALAESS